MAEVREFISEEAYYKVLKAFAAGAYDLKKELILAKLRTELQITDQRHTALRKLIEEDEAPRDRQPVGVPSTRDRGPGLPAKRKRELESFAGEDASELRAPASAFQHAAGGGNGAAGRRPANFAKRLRHDGNEGPGQAPMDHPAFAGDINELIGYKIQRYWPENGGWFSGAITDYRAATGEHCIVYDMNTADESYEWFNISRARRGEFQLMNEKINIIEHAPKAAPAAALGRAAAEARLAPKKPGYGGRGLTNGRGRGRPNTASFDGRRGHSSQEFDQTAYQPVSRPNGAGAPSAFVVESDDDISSDESFSD